MATRGFRTIPVVDDAEKPIGILFTRHFVRFIVSLFRKATMNLPPDQELKHPDQIHGG
jgi:CBS domain-containing protein